MEKRSHDGLNILKGIACIVVVFLHISFPGIVGKAIVFELRFSVPIFFMITGYFAYFSRNNVPKYKKKILRLAKILLVTEFFYGLFALFTICILQGNNLSTVFENYTFWQHPIKTLLCGTMFNSKLWYLYAALWTWVIYLIFARLKALDHNQVYILIPLLVLVLVFGRLYFQNHWDITKYVYLFRNALVFGLPMTLLGSFICKNRETLLHKFTPLKASIVILVGGAMSIVEYVLSHYLFEVRGLDFHISTLFTSFGLFMLALSFPNINKKSVIGYIGDKLYMWIYLSHIFSGIVISIIASSFHVQSSTLYMWLRPILTLFLSCLIGIVINKIQTAYKSKRIKS